MKFIFCLLLAVTITAVVLPARAQDWDLEGPQRGQSLILDIVYQPEIHRAELNQRNLNRIEISPDPPPGPSGSFLIVLKDRHAIVLYRDHIDLHPGRNLIMVPYFLTVSSITVTDPAGVSLLQSAPSELAAVNACNENNHCDPGEEALCPLDCPTAQNLSYPRPPGVPAAPPPSPLATSVAPDTSLRQFRLGLIAVAVGLFVLIGAALIIFSRRH